MDDVERIWPTQDSEADDRARHPAEWARYEFAATFAAGRRVVDCACGAGYGSALLLRRGARSVTGVDVSDEALAHARKNFPGPDFRKGDGLTLPLADASVDLAVSLETIEHAKDPALFLAELARVLVPQGTLVLSTPLTRGEARLKPVNPYHLREFDEAELGALVEPRFELVQRLGMHSRESRAFADLQQGRGGAVVRSGLHRLLPAPLRALARRLLRRGTSAPEAWVSEERWTEAPVQLVVGRKRG